MYKYLYHYREVSTLYFSCEGFRSLMVEDHQYSRVTSTPSLCRTRTPSPAVRRKKRSAIGRPTKKAGAKPRGQQDVVRDWNRQERVTAVDHALDLLTNPFDHMSLDQKKELALFRFYRQLKVKIIVHQSCFTMQRLLNRRHSAQARHTCLLQLASLLRLRRRWG